MGTGPAVITTTQQFADDEFVTATKLNAIISGSTIADINNTNMDDVTRVVTVGTTAPLDPDANPGALWWDSNEHTLKVADDSLHAYVSASLKNETLLYNKNYDSSGLKEGDVVVVHASEATSVDLPSTEAQQNVIGVVAEDADFNDTARINRGGVVRVNFTVVPAIGEYVIAKGGSTFDDRRRATTSSTQVPGAFAQVVGTAGNDGVTDYADCFVYGQVFAGLPTNAIILWSATTSCPAGFTRVSDYDGKYMKAGTDPDLTGGVNAYTTELTDEPTAGDYKWQSVVGTGGSGDGYDLENNPSPEEGGHVHGLNSLTNEPAYKTVLLCQKD